MNPVELVNFNDTKNIAYITKIYSTSNTLLRYYYWFVTNNQIGILKNRSEHVATQFDKAYHKFWEIIIALKEYRKNNNDKFQCDITDTTKLTIVSQCKGRYLNDTIAPVFLNVKLENTDCVNINTENKYVLLYVNIN